MNAQAPAATAAPRNNLVEPEGKPQAKILNLLNSPKALATFKQVIPRHLNPERMLRVMVQAVHKTPKLAECDPISLLGSMMACASLGMEPNTPLGHAYLIPFEVNRWDPNARRRILERVDVQLIIGYRGYIDLARRSGTLVAIHADVVYKGDNFSFEYGSDMHLRHIPQGAREGREKLWGYAHAKLTDGQAFEVLPYPEIEAIRNATQGYRAALRSKEDAEKNERDKWKMKSWESAPWVAFEHEMASKTLIRRLAKMLPMSIEFANAAALDAMSETGKVDFTQFSDPDSPALVDMTMAERPMAMDMGSDGPEAEQQPEAQPAATRAAPKAQQRQPQPQARQQAAAPPAQDQDDGPMDQDGDPGAGADEPQPTQAPPRAAAKPRGNFFGQAEG